jgi:uncharacterized membrane protein YbhN (UPF0104 family)
MRRWGKKWWPAVKLGLALALLFFIGRRFWEDLQEPGLWDRSFRPEWMVLSALSYVLALSCWALVWKLLLWGLGQRLRVAGMLRAYYIGQLGKYLPLKAWSLVMRAALAGRHGVSAGLAGLMAFYEVLVDMAAGAMLACVLLFALGPGISGPMDWQALVALFRLETPAGGLDGRVFALLAIILFLPMFMVLVPPVFNRLANRLSVPFREKGAAPLPRVGWRLLGLGLLVGGCSWFLMGASLWAMLQAVLTEPPAWGWQTWALYTGYTGLAYVAGFIILIVPSGLGVREFFLTLLLTSGEGFPSDAVVLAVLVLRLVCTTAELLVTAAVSWMVKPGDLETEERV